MLRPDEQLILGTKALQPQARTALQTTLGNRAVLLTNSNQVGASGAGSTQGGTTLSCVTSLAPVGATPNADGATIAAGVLTLEPADATNPGVLTAGAQTIGGPKNFLTDINIHTLTVGRGGGSVDGNTALGFNVLTNNINGVSNTAGGWNTQFNNTNGNGNTSYGQQVLANNIVGSYSSGFGYQTLLNCTASYNSSFGANSGATIVSAIQCVVAGYAADVPSASANGQMSLGNIIYGFANIGTGQTPSTGRIAIGKNTDDGVNQLQVAGSIVGSNLSGTNTGDQTITLSSDVTGTGTTAIATTIAANAVTNAKAAQMPTLTVKGNNTGGTANATDLTVAQVNAMLGGVTSLAPIGASPNANGATIVGGVLTLEQADATHGGVLTATGQTIGGIKTFTGFTEVQNNILTSSASAGYQFADRTSARIWQWYATSDIARFWNGAADILTIDGVGNFSVKSAGSGFRTAEGANAKQGTAVLVAGSVVVANTSVTATSRIFLTAQSLGTITLPAALAVTARTAGTSFTISSGAITDTSTVAYEIFEVG